jgi:transcriptional regulator with XRE-family HTH domain
MSEKESRAERLKRFARIWTLSRSNAGKSQEFMANGLGVSKKTIQNWEKGVSSPDLFSGSEWFRVLGINPLPYYLAFLYPELFDGIAPESNDQVIEEAIELLVRNSTAQEKRQLLYLMAGRHGSSWYSLLQLFCAHCHTSMRSRVNAARMIADNYDMDEETGALVCPGNIRPDMDMLRHSIEDGKNAVMTGAQGYTSVPTDDLKEMKKD